MKKYLIFLPLLFMATSVSASVLAEQPYQEAPTTSRAQPACQTFTASASGIPSALTYRFQNGSATTSYVNLVQGASTCVDGGARTWPPSGTLVASGTTICAGACSSVGDGTATTSFSSAGNILSGDTYTIFWNNDINITGATNANTLYGTGEATSTFPRYMTASSTPSVYKGGSGQYNAFFVLSGNGTFGLPDMIQKTILYPQNRTDIFIHDFTHFTFVATNTDVLAHNLNFRIIYDSTSTLDYAPVSVSRNIQYGFAPGSTHYLNIPKAQTLASSTTYYAKLCVSQDSGNFSCGEVISFKLGAVAGGFKVNTEVAGFYNSTTTEAGIMYPTTTTDIVSETGLECGQEFYNPANWACWAGQRIVLLFNELKDFAVGTFEMGFDFFRQTFPINILSQLSTDLNSVRYSTSTISSISFTGQGTAYKKASGGYYSFTFLTSSTLQESETAVGWNWETIVIYLLWALCGIVIVGSAFALIKHAGHNSTPHA